MSYHSKGRLGDHSDPSARLNRTSRFRCIVVERCRQARVHSGSRTALDDFHERTSACCRCELQSRHSAPCQTSPSACMSGKGRKPPHALAIRRAAEVGLNETVSSGHHFNGSHWRVSLTTREFGTLLCSSLRPTSVGLRPPHRPGKRRRLPRPGPSCGVHPSNTPGASYLGV